ncbi:hypothetical protein HQ563_03260, partial [bacterium]|nr:hypothetical protein [bacterium]
VFNKFDPTDADKDADDDGQANLGEFVAGTHPRDDGSVLRVDEMSLNGEMILRWQSVPGMRYWVGASDDMSDWRTVSGEITALEETTEWRDATVSSASKRFYRVVVVP